MSPGSHPHTGIRERDCNRLDTIEGDRVQAITHTPTFMWRHSNDVTKTC